MASLGSNTDNPFKILLVEDNPGDAELVRQTLASESKFICSILHTESLKNAVREVLSHQFDAVILDLSLPDSFGIESVERMCDVAPELPILVLTGSVEEKAGPAALNAGAQDYLVKGDLDAKSLIRALTYGYERHRFAIAARANLDKKNQELLKTHETLEATSRELKKASQTKSEFLANMSHEIRTPLGAMLGFAQLMGDPAQSLSDRKDCIATILRNGEQLARVINEILDLSKIESDKMEIENLEFSIVEVVESVAALLNLQAEEKGLKFTVSFDDDVPNFIVSDPTRLRQILFNVVGNAIKFTAEGSVSVKVSLMSPVASGKKTLRISVKDSGRGLSSEQQIRLFKPFVQADASTTREYGGTGLGLLLSKRLAKALGGDIVITNSELGVGSTFLITFEIGDAKSPSMSCRDIKKTQQLKFESNETLPDLAGLKVLVVDDSPDNRVLISRFLSAAAAIVECAVDGSDGIDKALVGDFDVILMDIQMPKVDGFAALEMLRVQNYKPPIIALTAHAMKGDRERCLAAGFDDHIVKPINRNELLGRLANVRALH